MAVDRVAAWGRATIGDLADINHSLWAPSKGGTINYLDLTGVPRAGHVIKPREIQASRAPSRARRRAAAGDILVSTVRPYLRGFALIRNAPANLVVSTGFSVVSARTEADRSFLYQHILSDNFIEYLKPRMTGSNYPAVRPADVADYPIPLPPSDERRRIGQVLDAIDQAIERSTAAIEATEVLRQALLHELLARGVPGRHASWRYVPGLGTVPACWSATTVGEVSAQVTKGATPTTYGHKWAESGPVFLRSECVGEGVLLPAAAMHVTQAAHDGMRRSHVRDGDILMTITGYIGRVCRVPDGFGEASINQHIARIRVLPDRATNMQFAYWALMSPRTRRALRDQVTGIAYPQIGLAEVRGIVLPVPPPNEQIAIAAALEDAAARVAAEAGRLTCLRVLKQAAADALLTGRVRVAATVRAGSVVA